MAIDTFRRLLVFLLLCLAQALVLGRIQLFGCATPMLCAYFIIAIPRGYPRWATLLWGFSLGLAIDMFVNTPGVTAAAMTATAFLQPFLVEVFLPHDAEPNIKASAQCLGIWRFLCLAAILTLVFCMLFFALETFSFFHWMTWVVHTGASTLFTLLLIMILETLRQ